jgi:hypothetical protein
MYAEWASDPVVQSLSFDDQRHHAVLLCLKCNGTLDRAIANDQRERIILRGLGLDNITAGEVKRRLLEVGLIDDSWQPNGWDKRQYTSDLSTNRVRKYRNNKESGNVTETAHETAGNSFGNGPEQSRTEQKRKESNTSSEPSGSPPADPDFFIRMPLNNGDSYGVQTADVEEFKKLYPAVNVEQSLRSMRAWCIANPTKRKTAKGILRFINTWLSKDQDRGGNHHEAHQRPDNSARGRVFNATHEKVRGH